MKGNKKSDIKVEDSKEMKGEWRENWWRKYKYLKNWFNVKKKYRKIGNKKNNEMDADVTQLELSCHKPNYKDRYVTMAARL